MVLVASVRVVLFVFEILSFLVYMITNVSGLKFLLKIKRCCFYLKKNIFLSFVSAKKKIFDDRCF